jgi:hypothetical protein
MELVPKSGYSCRPCRVPPCKLFIQFHCSTTTYYYYSENEPKQRIKSRGVQVSLGALTKIKKSTIFPFDFGIRFHFSEIFSRFFLSA